MPKNIFQEDWWCDASNPGEWHKIEIEDGGRKLAEFTFARKKKYGFYEVGMPYLSRAMDPVISIDAKKPTTRLDSNVRLIKKIADALPKYDHFWYTLPPESDNELAFNLAGFQTESQYTFRRYPDDPEDIWESMEQKTRNIVKKGLAEFELEIHGDLDRYIRVSRQFVARRSWFNKIDYDAVQRIWSAAYSRSQAAVLSVSTPNQRDCAVAIVVWDDQCLYYWLATRHPAAAGNSANSVLIWHAMELAKQKGLIFDLDGYASPSSGQFLSRFGLKPLRRAHVTSISTIANWSANSRLLIKSLAPITLKTTLMGL